MIQIAICLPDEAEASYISTELETCYHARNLMVSIQIFHSTKFLLHELLSYKPDIFIYSLSDELLHVARKYKSFQPNMISFIKTDLSKDTNMDSLSLQPIYELSEINRKVLWEYARKAYDIYINDNLTFSYYRRPQYVSTPINDILYFVSEARRIHLFSTHHTQQTFYNKLDNVEYCLSHKKGKFIRIHKSFLVNAKYITYVDRNKIQLSTGEELKISSYERYIHLMHELHSCKIK